MKKLLTMLLAVSFFSPAYAATIGITKTALYLLVEENADYDPDANPQELDRVIAELEAIEASALLPNNSKVTDYSASASLSDSIIIRLSDELASSMIINPGQIVTGYAPLDAALGPLQVSRIDEISSGKYLVVTYQAPLNPYRVVRSFDGISGVEHVGINQIIGGGTRVSRSLRNGIAEYVFAIGHGDCQSGCIYWRRYFYHVDQELRVWEQSREE